MGAVLPDRLFQIATKIKNMDGIEQDAEQHRIRSVVNRAYYAAYLTAEEVCRQKGFEGSGASHERVVDALLKQKSLSSVGNKLKDIKSLRHHADYKWQRPLSPRDMQSVLKKSRSIIDTLKAL